MDSLPFPASGGVLDAFLERVRFSPRATVDTSWLVSCLGISQTSNAGRTLRWLTAAGILNGAGRLSERGHELVDASLATRREAAKHVLSALISEEVLEKLRSRKLTRAGLQKDLLDRYGVKESAANKAIAGMHAVARIAGESNIVRALGSGPPDLHKPKYPSFDPDESKRALLSRFGLFTGKTGGIDVWLHEETPPETFARLQRIRFEPLTAPQLNQLLALAHAAPMSQGFFHYYWLSKPPHPYDLESVPGFNAAWEDALGVFELDQLYWGLYRFYTDALLFFGNVRLAYRVLRILGLDELRDFFKGQMLDTQGLMARGSSLALSDIDRDNRYLIAEQACKSYDPGDYGETLETALKAAYTDHLERGGKCVTVADLLDAEGGKCPTCDGAVGEGGSRFVKDESKYIRRMHGDKQLMFRFAADEILTKKVCSEHDLEEALTPIKARFHAAHGTALKNTDLYLSSVGELDVYVATSMRSRQHFHEMAEFCDRVFGDRQLHQYHLRYFDPTMSAARNHEDKGLIECLMVKCAKMLIYNAGESDSYGKDAEAAMALSLGRPVIFFCNQKTRQQFYREVHPLSRLVNFQTGVAVGAMITDKEEDVVLLIERLLTNSMQYVLEQKNPLGSDGYVVLKERITDCVVRLQTDDDLLRETFWNHYHGASGRDNATLLGD